MNAEQSIEEALILLEQMSEDPNEILQVLDEAEQFAMVEALDVLTERAATIQSGEELLCLADAIHHLVEDRSGLKALLLPEGTDVAVERTQRTVTLADQQATTELNVYAQRRTPQIHNALIECRKQLEAALRKTAGPEDKHTEGKSHDSAKP